MVYSFVPIFTSVVPQNPKQLDYGNFMCKKKVLDYKECNLDLVVQKPVNANPQIMKS